MTVNTVVLDVKNQKAQFLRNKHSKMLIVEELRVTVGFLKALTHPVTQIAIVNS